MTPDLVGRAQLGDHDAFDVLASRVYHHLYAVARRILRDEYAAEDAVQEALVRAWRDLRGLREPDRFEAWLHRLLVRACADQARTARRRLVTVPMPEVEPAAPAGDVESFADRDELERAFLQLSVEHRAVLVLVMYVGLSGPEVASMLGIPEGTVHSRLHYASRQMRTILGRPQGSHPEHAR